MSTKHGVDPSGRFKGRLPERRTLPLSPRIEGIAANEHDFKNRTTRNPQP
jgi:hypothetical protein